MFQLGFAKLSLLYTYYSDQALFRLEKHKSHVAERWRSSNLEHPGLQLKDIFNECHRPPRLDDLLDAVRDAEAAWEKKKSSGLGKTKQAIENFMDAMSSHSYLFSVIPSNDKYTCLVTGMMTSITKAFVNHKEVAELFSDTLEIITKDLATVRESVRISNTPQMRLLVVDLYVAVFDFLCDAMDWYGGSRRKRFMGSLRQDYTDDINRNTSKVQGVLARIRLEADQATQSRVRDSHQDVRHLRDGQEFLSRRLDVIEELLVTAGNKNRDDLIASKARLDSLADQFLLVLGEKAMRTLVANGRTPVTDTRSPKPYLDQVGTKAPIVTLTPASRPANAACQSFCDRRQKIFTVPIHFYRQWKYHVSQPVSYTRNDIREMSAPFLRRYLEDGRSEVAKGGSSISRPSLPSEVAHKVTTWIRDPCPLFLWVEGPVSTSAERQISAVAMLLCDLALSSRASVLCISFTPRLMYPAQKEAGPSVRQERVLIAMFYSLAGHLIQLLPEELDSMPHSFELQVFQRLDGSIASVSAALDLIETLLAHGPQTVMLIINRLQVAECASTTPHLEPLVKIFKAHASPKRMAKALFITQGASPALARTMDLLTEKVDARRMVQAKPGRPLSGWSSLGNLKIPDQNLE
ncbi:hypothetical protein C7999DRAFT_15812 [Corynascus novoguineensis]|uniref:DUF7708 domain-containing protein n=1 Tax=Corynascus novoguineensis TaxID=1126955 RepID=A0AAN7CQJ6_9PEZI|nr:hypothetical protein C7999DRAFT_15812 [Corynascus novoguineensis]